MSFAHKVVAWVMQQQGYLTLPYLRGPLGRYQLLILPPGGGYSREFWIGVCREGS